MAIHTLPGSSGWPRADLATAATVIGVALDIDAGNPIATRLAIGTTHSSAAVLPRLANGVTVATVKVVGGEVSTVAITASQTRWAAQTIATDRISGVTGEVTEATVTGIGLEVVAEAAAQGQSAWTGIARQTVPRR